MYWVLLVPLAFLWGALCAQLPIPMWAQLLLCAIVGWWIPTIITALFGLHS